MSKDNDEMIPVDQFIALRSDVKEILAAIEGNPKLGHRGIVQRIEDAESEIDIARRERASNRREFDRFKYKIIYWTAGAAAAATAIINVIIAVWTNA